MNSKQRDVKRKHAKRKKCAHTLDSGKKLAQKKELHARAVGWIMWSEQDEFRTDLGFIDMGRYAKLELVPEKGDKIVVTLIASPYWVELMRHSFHNKTGGMKKWGERFRVSLV